MYERASVAVFDSGVGSSSIAQKLRTRMPHERIVYLADRASFPYGEKSHDELADIIERTVLWLEKEFEPKLIVVASNTPSLQVLKGVQEKHTTPLLGVFPPIQEASKQSKTGHIALLATKGAVQSPEMRAYIERSVSADITVRTVDAGALVALVEPGTFLSDREHTAETVRATIDSVLMEDPRVDVMTLSSTHLPFLMGYFRDLYPGIVFLDPAERVTDEAIKLLGEISATNSEGELMVFTTEGKGSGLGIENLTETLARLGLSVAVEPVEIG